MTNSQQAQQNSDQRLASCNYCVVQGGGTLEPGTIHRIEIT